MRSFGLFPDRSIARRIDRELFVLLGGTAALLMQIAHPLVAAGVTDHSSFDRDPIGRLRRTLDTTLEVVFGDTDGAMRAIRRIDARHRVVVGTAADGRPYRAHDPALLLWVQTTLILTSLRLYEAAGGTLTASEREAYWNETKPVAIALGIPATLLPETVDELLRYERVMLATEVIPDTTGVRLGRKVLRPFAWLPAFLHWPFDAITAALLPAPLRAPFGLRWRRRDRALAHGVIVTLRVLRRTVPDRIAIVPQAKRAA